MAVTDGGDSEAGGQIDIEIAVDVPNVASGGLLPEKRDRIRNGGKGVDARRFCLGEPAGELP
jgi:hypothetical protein